MYSRILVPLDGSDRSEHALSFAVALGDAFDCPIQLLRVPEKERLYTVGDGEVVPPEYQVQFAEEAKAECRGYLDKIAGSLLETGLEVATVVQDGMVAQSIVEEAKASPDTIIVMASHGRSGISRWIMGSVADEVLRGSDSPLLLVRPRDGGGATVGATLTRIVTPVDGSGLAEQVFPHVAALAKALDARVDLVRVTPSASEYYGQAGIHPIGGTPASYLPPYEEFSEAADAEAQAYLDQTRAALEELGVSSVQCHLVHGQPATVISDIAKTDPGSMVVMTTHGRSGIGRWVLGSVADSVARNSGTPVLLIRAREKP